MLVLTIEDMDETGYSEDRLRMVLSIRKVRLSPALKSNHHRIAFLFLSTSTRTVTSQSRQVIPHNRLKKVYTYRCKDVCRLNSS